MNKGNTNIVSLKLYFHFEDHLSNHESCIGIMVAVTIDLNWIARMCLELATFQGLIPHP